MKTSNHTSYDKLTNLYDNLSGLADPYLGQPNNSTNTLWSKDYRGFLINSADGGSPTQISTIEILNNDNTTTELKIPESIFCSFVLPLHVKINTITVLFNALQIDGLK